MGLYDEIGFRCKECGEAIYTQSKAGSCILKVYSCNKVPLVIAKDIHGTGIYCDKCGYVNTVLIDNDPKCDIEMKVE